MKKKIITVLLASVLALSTLVGCGNDETLNYEVGQRINFMELDANKYMDDIEYEGLVDFSNIQRISDEEVEAQIRSYLEYYEVYKDSKDTTVLEDSVIEIDFEGYIDEYQFPGGTATAQTLNIANNTYIDGFAEPLIGHEVGETIEVNTTFPEDYGSSYQNAEGNYISLNGVDVTFYITINKIYGDRIFNYEDLTDEGVIQLTGGYYTNIEDLKKGEIEWAYNNEVSEIATKLWDILVDNFKIKKGAEKKFNALVENEVKYINDYYKVMSEYYGYDNFEDFIHEMLGHETIDVYNDYVNKDANYIVKQNLIVKYVVDKNNLWLDDEEYVETANKLAQEYGYANYDDFIVDYDANELAEYIYYDIAADFIAHACGY